jgi:hypothetical protein
MSLFALRRREMDPAILSVSMTKVVLRGVTVAVISPLSSWQMLQETRIPQEFYPAFLSDYSVPFQPPSRPKDAILYYVNGSLSPFL